MLCDVVRRRRRWAHAPVIHAACHFDHEKRVAWVPISMHTCGSFFYNRPLSRGGHFESQGNKKLCFCPSSLALDERLDGQNLLFQHCVIKFYYGAPLGGPSGRRSSANI